MSAEEWTLCSQCGEGHMRVPRTVRWRAKGQPVCSERCLVLYLLRPTA